MNQLQDYSFDKISQRRGTGAIKWDHCPYADPPADAIPMWIADMDFDAAPAVMKSIKKVTDEPVMGYFDFTDEYYNAILGWHKTRHNRADFTREQISYHNGVLGGVATMISAYTNPGDPILVQGAGYPAFKMVIDRMGRTLEADPMINNNGYYTYNFEQMEKTIKEKNIKLAILCNPHNPTGRVWSREELSEYIKICYRNNVKIAIDEIWADVELNRSERPYLSAFLASEKAKEIAVGFYSASKGFNLAGLVASYSICYNPEIMAALDAISVPGHYNSPNILSTQAVIGAYSDEGAEWLDACLDYINSNVDIALDFFKEHMPKLKVRRPDATYVCWLDFTAYGISQDELVRRTAYEAGVILNNGSSFLTGGEGFMRMNMATPRAYVEQALPRLKAAFADIE